MTLAFANSTRRSFVVDDGQTLALTQTTIPDLMEVASEYKLGKSNEYSYGDY